MIYHLLFLFLWAKAPVCANQAIVHKDYPQLKTKLDKKIREASNLEAIAQEADTVLSKLIANKSPVLLTWLDKRELMAATEEEIAKQWRQYYFENFVLLQYPTQNQRINRSVQNLFEQINEESFDADFKRKAEELLKKVKDQAKKLVVSWPIEKKSKTRITHKIDTVELYWFDKLKGSPYENSPLEFVRWGLAYDPPKNRINMGIEARMYPTDASFFAALAHEIGHAFDPCRWSFYFQSENPFQPLIQCFRKEKGLAAKKRDDSKMLWAVENNKLTEEMAGSLKKHLTCNRSFYPPEGTQKEQSLEIFADWFSAEVFARSEYSSEFPRPDLCAKRQLSRGSSYLPNATRLNKIYFAHPKLTKDKDSSDYCALNP